MHRLTYGLIVALAIALAAGCVKKSTYERALADLADSQRKLGDAESELASKNKQIEKLEGELSATKAELDKLTADERSKKAQIEKLMADMQTTEQELAELRKQRDQAEKRLKAFRELNERFRALVDTGKLKVSYRNGQMVLELPSGVLFPSGQAKLSRTGEKALSEVLDILKEFNDRRFQIAGHTDNLPIRSRKFKDNWELSNARALSVVRFMIEAGFPAKNLAAVGKGQFDPVAPNDTEEGRQLNRRIEIILVPDLSELPNLTADPS